VIIKKIMTIKIQVFNPKIYKEDIKSVINSLKKNQISGTQNKIIENFENNFAKFVKSKYAISTSSGTTALHLCINALNLKKGSEVIVSSCTNIATALAIYHNNLIPVPIDSDAENWNIKLELIEKNITKKTKAIIVVHFLGNPVDMNKVMKIAKKYKLYVIEDAAEAHGAKINKRLVGSIAHMGCFSFYSNKIITCGEGGAITTNNKKLYKKIRLLKNLAFSKKRFIHYQAGFNFRLSSIQAAMVNSQLKKINSIIKLKIKIANLYKNFLICNKGVEFQKQINNSLHVHWMFGIKLNRNYPTNANKLIQILKKNGIETRTFFFSIRNQPCLKEIIKKKTPSTPVSDDLWKNGLYLPSTHHIKKKNIKKICDIINNPIKYT
jgi:perosamine synthetase